MTPALQLLVQHTLWLLHPLLQTPVFLVPKAAYTTSPFPLLAFLIAVKSQ